MARLALLFAVHAHLRALSVKNGGVYAEAVAQKFRRQCGREDFSEFWAHIPFGMMESLRTGVRRAQHGWILAPEAIGKGWQTSTRRLSNEEIEALAFDPSSF